MRVRFAHSAEQAEIAFWKGTFQAVSGTLTSGLNDQFGTWIFDNDRETTDRVFLDSSAS